MAQLFICLLVTFLLYQETTATEVTVHGRLIKHLRESISRPPLIPISQPGEKVPVAIQLEIQGIENVDREKNQVDLSLMLSFMWPSGITWDPAQFNDLDHTIVPKTLVWRPDIFIRNAVTKPVSSSPANAILFSHGGAVFNDHIRVTVACDVSGKDDDRCHLDFISQSLNNDFMVLGGPEKAPISIDWLFGLFRHKDGRYQAKDGEYTKRLFEHELFSDVYDVLEYKFTVKDTRPNNRHQLTYRWH